MKVMKFTDKAGNVFYNADYCQELVGETARRLGYNCSIELVEMSADEYMVLPATQEAAQLWRSAAA